MFTVSHPTSAHSTSHHATHHDVPSPTMKTAVLISLLLAVGLAFATFFVMRKPPAPVAAPVAWLLGLSESSIDAIRFSWGDKADDLRIVSDGRAGWKMERSAAKGGTVQWPVQSAQVRGGLRLLAELASRVHSDQAVMRNAQTTLIAFSMGGREVGSMRIATKGLGGQAPAIINDATPRFVFVDEALSRAFLREGILQWRAPLALPGMAAGARHISISNPNANVELGKAQGRWLVQKPFQTPAADAAIKQLLTTLANLSLSKFVDDAEGDETKLGFATLLASITVETEQPTSNGARPVLVEQIEVGAPADVARTTLFVRVRASIRNSTGESTPAWGPVVGVIERSRLDAIAGEAGVYASKAVLRESAADIMNLRLADAKGEGVAFQRTIDGWFVVDSSGKPGVKVESERAKAVQQLIEILCTERATKVREADVPDVIVMTTVETSVAEGPLPSADVVVCAIKGKASVGVRTKGVLRLYADADERKLEELVRVIWAK